MRNYHERVVDRKVQIGNVSDGTVKLKTEDEKTLKIAIIV